MIASGATAQIAPSTLNVATAQKMASACVAYAGANNGAVSIWVYDDQGVHEVPVEVGPEGGLIEMNEIYDAITQNKPVNQSG